MATTRQHSDPINERKREHAEDALGLLLESMRNARRAARMLDQHFGEGPAVWQALSARTSDDKPLLSYSDRRLIVYGLSEVSMACGRILWRIGFISGSQSDSDEKGSENPDAD